MFPSVVKEPGITKTPDNSSLCVDTFWQYPVCCLAIESGEDEASGKQQQRGRAMVDECSRDKGTDRFMCKSNLDGAFIAVRSVCIDWLLHVQNLGFFWVVLMA